MTATRSLSSSLQRMGQTLLADEPETPSDDELVAQFVACRDENAFAVLMRRHGPMVLGVCRRVLRHQQDAEDASQATFLVLARNATKVQRAGAIGNWLYGVAYNIARKARSNRYRHDMKEQTAADTRPRETPPAEPEEFERVLDEEIKKLPNKYREAIVLCDLEQLTTEEAARIVGCPAKTLSTRLSRGRARLAAGLTRRGFARSAVGIPAVLAEVAPVSAAVLTRLIDSTASAAPAFADGSAAVVTPAVAVLTTGVTDVMLHSSLKLVLLACCALAVASVPGAPVSHLRAAPQVPRDEPASAVPDKRKPERPVIDPRPAGVLYVDELGIVRERFIEEGQKELNRKHRGWYEASGQAAEFKMSDSWYEIYRPRCSTSGDGKTLVSFQVHHINNTRRTPPDVVNVELTFESATAKLLSVELKSEAAENLFKGGKLEDLEAFLKNIGAKGGQLQLLTATKHCINAVVRHTTGTMRLDNGNVYGLRGDGVIVQSTKEGFIPIGGSGCIAITGVKDKLYTLLAGEVLERVSADADPTQWRIISPQDVKQIGAWDGNLYGKRTDGEVVVWRGIEADPKAWVKVTEPAGVVWEENREIKYK